jgi:uncharacterized protein YjbI with pentapeptide repeats
MLKSIVLTAILIATLMTSPAIAEENPCRNLSQGYMRADYQTPQKKSFANAWAHASILKGADLPTVEALVAAASRPIIVQSASFAGKDFRGIHLKNVCFNESDLSNTDWSGAATEGLAFFASNTTNMKAVGATFKDAIFLNGDFEGMNFSKAVLTNLYMQCPLFMNERQCSWGDRGIDLSDADVSGMRLNVAYMPTPRASHVTLNKTTLGLGQVEWFRDAKVKGPVIVSSMGYVTSTHVTLSKSEWPKLLAGLGMVQHNRPSFDCALARTAIESTICNSQSGYPVLAALDRDLSGLVKQASKKGLITDKDQAIWLSERDQCGSDAKAVLDPCLAEKYTSRIETLRRKLTDPNWLPVGTVAIFVSTDIRFSERFKTTALYRRLLPVVLDSAQGDVYLHAKSKDNIEAIGGAMGGNGHSCTLYKALMKLNPTTGWYISSKPTNDDATPPKANAETVNVLRIVGDEAWVSEDESGYASCGARASWDRMTRLDMPQYIAKKLWKKSEPNY